MCIKMSHCCKNVVEHNNSNIESKHLSGLKFHLDDEKNLFSSGRPTKISTLMGKMKDDVVDHVTLLYASPSE